MKHSVRRLKTSDATSYRDLRLEGLKISPEAFGATWDDEVNKSVTYFEEILNTNTVLGGYVDGIGLAGVFGFFIPSADKTCHKGTLWGMFIRPGARGSGLSRLLIEGMIREAEGVVETLLLTVVESNIAAVRLYKECGFEAYGIERNAMKLGSQYYDELLMSFTIKTRR